MKSQYFRASVGLIVTDGSGRVLAVERFRQPGQWQLPQGGIHNGEEPMAAALRELREELGLKARHLEFVTEHPQWLAYELPESFRSSKTGRGQVQKWLVFRLVAPERKIRLDHGQDHRELRAWSWRRLDELAQDVAPFRAGVYRRIAQDFAALDEPDSTPSPEPGQRTVPTPAPEHRER